jgi:hypothetical protein
MATILSSAGAFRFSSNDVNDVVEPIQRIVILLICFKLYYISNIINIILKIYIMNYFTKYVFVYCLIIANF